MFDLQTMFLFLFGLFVGTIGTMLGLGAGWVHVPFFLLVFGFTPQDAIGTSLGIIFFNTLAGSIVYYHRKQMDYGLAKSLALAVLPGAIFGPFIAQRFDSMVFSFLFSFILFLIAYYMFFGGGGFRLLPEKRYSSIRTVTDASGHVISYKTSLELGVIGTVVIGFFSNIFGVGGGIIHIPFLILVLGVPTHIALGTSHFLLCISSFVGTSIYFMMGNVKIDFMMTQAVWPIRWRRT